jgi:hypothetical protein
MQAPGRGAVPYQRARGLVAAAVPRHVKVWAETIGLQSTDARFAQFGEDVTEALHACMRAHIAAHRWTWVTARAAYSRLAKDYAAIAQLLRPDGGVVPPFSHSAPFNALPPLWPDPPLLRPALRQFSAALEPYGDAAAFEGLAKAARQYADLCVGKDGRPPPFAFDALWLRLMVALEQATKRKATITHREDLGEWGGSFFRLVEAIWPVARGIAEKVTGRALEASTSSGRGKHLQRGLKFLRSQSPSIQAAIIAQLMMPGSSRRH